MAEELREAMKGWGTDEGGLIDVICVKTFEEMAEIRQSYTDDIGRDLIKDIKSECSGDFEDILVGLCRDRARYDAELLRKAMKGMGTNETLLSEVLCYRTKDELKAIEEQYDEMYDTDLKTAIENDLSGNTEKLALKLLEPEDYERDPEDEKQVLEDVEKLYKAGQGKFGTDEGVFIRILGGSSREYREKLYWSYAENTKKGTALTKAIESEFSGTLEKMLVALVQPTYLYYIDVLFEAMDGMGTDEDTLIRVLVTQKERHLQKIAEEYLNAKGKTLEKHIESECGGNLQKALQAVLDNFAKLGED